MGTVMQQQRARADEDPLDVAAAAAAQSSELALELYRTLTGRRPTNGDLDAAEELAGIADDVLEAGMREMVDGAKRRGVAINSLAYFVEGLQERARVRAQAAVGAATLADPPLPAPAAYEALLAEAEQKPQSHFTAQLLRAIARECLARAADADIPTLVDWLEEERAARGLIVPRDVVEEIATGAWMHAHAPPTDPADRPAPAGRPAPSATKAS
jgi:hypothetical protein